MDPAYTNSGGQGSGSGSGFGMLNVVFILLGIAAIYYLYRFLYTGSNTSSTVLVGGQQAANVQPKITATPPPPFEGGEYTVNTWLYVSSFNTNRNSLKHVFEIQGEYFSTLLIALGAFKNTVVVRTQSDEVVSGFQSGGGLSIATSPYIEDTQPSRKGWMGNVFGGVFEGFDAASDAAKAKKAASDAATAAATACRSVGTTPTDECITAVTTAMASTRDATLVAAAANPLLSAAHSAQGSSIIARIGSTCTGGVPTPACYAAAVAAKVASDCSTDTSEVGVPSSDCIKYTVAAADAQAEADAAEDASTDGKGSAAAAAARTALSACPRGVPSATGKCITAASTAEYRMSLINEITPPSTGGASGGGGGGGSPSSRGSGSGGSGSGPKVLPRTWEWDPNWDANRPRGWRNEWYDTSLDSEPKHRERDRRSLSGWGRDESRKPGTTTRSGNNNSGASNTTPNSSTATLSTDGIDEMFTPMAADDSLLTTPLPCDLPEIDLQRWTMLTVVLSGRTIDVYLDGKLTRSCVTNSYYKVDPTGVKMNVLDRGGFDGYLGNTSVANHAMNPDEIYRAYLSGPQGTSLDILSWIVSLFKGA